MDIDGEERIAAPRDRVWKALNDLDTLQQCIPGCRHLEQVSPGILTATITIRFGPVSASFHSEITLSNVRAPESYTIAGEGKGGLAGFGRGMADVTLSEDGAETILRYSARGELGGKLARLGSGFVHTRSRKLAERFFADFNALVGDSPPDG